MPTKPVFSPEQLAVIRAAAVRVFEAKFEWMKKTKTQPGGQEAMGLAIGVSQQSVSNLLKGKYNPGWKVASNIANLDGQTLEQLLGHHLEKPAEPKAKSAKLPNLRKCIDFYEDEKHWSPWTIACAEAGYFGKDDFRPALWVEKLTGLEKLLERGRRGAT